MLCMVSHTSSITGCYLPHFWLSQLSYSYKLVKILSVCVWMLTRLEQIVTAAHRDLKSCRQTY